MFNFGKKYDFVAIGDNTTDAFIRLKDATTHCKIDKTACELCVQFGTKIPYESVDILHAVGNAANAAVSAARLGLRSALVSDIGDDENGRASVRELKRNNVSTNFIHSHKDMISNYDFVLWYDVERTILVKHETYPNKMPKGLNANWIYLSSFAHNNEKYTQEIIEYIEKNPKVNVAFQPATFEISLGAEKLSRIYKRTNAFFCNVEEAQKILSEESRDLPTLLEKIHNLGPKIVFITDGINGAYIRKENGEKFFMPVYPHKPVERTGAGDAFASTVVSGLAMGKSIDEAVQWAPINSMSVTQQVGAQKGLLPKEKIQEYIKNAPEDYKLKEL